VPGTGPGSHFFRDFRDLPENEQNPETIWIQIMIGIVSIVYTLGLCPSFILSQNFRGIRS